MKIRVWDVPAFWPRDIPRPKIGDIIEVDNGFGRGMIACECGREVKPGTSPESAARAQPERAVMPRPQPK